MRLAINANQCTKRARGGMRDEYAVSWFMHAGARRGTETCVREHFAGAQVQPLANGRPRGADDDAEARSEVSRSCEPVPKVLPNVRVHEWEHSDSRETVPAARLDAPERRDPYPARADRLDTCGAQGMHVCQSRPSLSALLFFLFFTCESHSNLRIHLPLICGGKSL